MTRLSRFVTKVAIQDAPACWEWQGSRTKNGYGTFRWDGTTRIVASRAAYLLFVGPIPEGFEVDHLCRNRGCVNPTHLEAISVQENRRRRHTPSGNDHWEGKRVHCEKGHPYSAANLRIAKDGSRICRACFAAYRQAWRADRRARGLPAP